MQAQLEMAKIQNQKKVEVEWGYLEDLCSQFTELESQLAPPWLNQRCCSLVSTALACSALTYLSSRPYMEIVQLNAGWDGRFLKLQQDATAAGLPVIAQKAKNNSSLLVQQANRGACDSKLLNMLNPN